MRNLILFDIEEKNKEKYKTYKNYEGSYQIEVKKFLTIQEINTIVNAMLEQDSIGRLLVRTALLVEFCTNIDIKQFVNEDGQVATNDIYDTLAENGILHFESIINNIYDIDEIIAQEESTYNVAVALSNAVEESLSKVNTNELMGAVTQLQSMANANNGNVIDFSNAKANKEK